MISVIINVYACNPYWGSEQGLGWNWVKHLGRYCKLYVITEGEFKDNIEKELSKLAYSENITFYYNPLPDKVRKMCWNQGDWRFYYYYDKWQKITLKIAQEIIKDNQIDLIHQLNMGGFREPGYLWEINNIPFIWGPVDAKERFPLKYTDKAGAKVLLFLKVKNTLTKLQLLYSRKVRNAVRNSQIIVSSTSDSIRTFQKYFNKESVLIHDTACNLIEFCEVEKNIDPNEIFNILWVGKFDFRKQLDLALLTIKEVKHLNVKFHIVGGTNEQELKYKKIAFDLGIADCCVWHGLVNHYEIHQLMQKSDLLFFTSVAEGTPTVVSEAICNHLPILCFETCGQGDVVTALVGKKIRLSNPSQSIKEFSNEISYLYNNRKELKLLSENCNSVKHNHTWEYRASQMIELYKKIK